jgi:hypothetical protein
MEFDLTPEWISEVTFLPEVPEVSFGNILSMLLIT